MTTININIEYATAKSIQENFKILSSKDLTINAMLFQVIAEKKAVEQIMFWAIRKCDEVDELIENDEDIVLIIVNNGKDYKYSLIDCELLEN
jgi:hypothetical protein